MPVEIISVGSSYILQHAHNNSVATIANHLLELGIEVDFVSSVIGQETRLEAVLRQAIDRSTLIFVIGGVSTGEYDVTKKLLTRVLQKRLVLNYRVLDRIKAQFQAQGETMPRAAEKRALVPTDAEILENESGTVPGFLFSYEKRHVILLPGIIAELEAMLTNDVLPRLDPKTFHRDSVGIRMVKTCGVSPIKLKTWLKHIDRENRYQTLNYVTDGEETTIIITVRNDIQHDVEKKLASIETQIIKKLGDYVYGTGSQTLEAVVGGLLAERGQTLAVAESCSGGMISARLTDIPGSSAYFERGVVSYSNEAKISLLDVSPNVIEAHGAVSAETAVAMAEGVRWLAQTTFGLAVTGIAGPGGGTDEKPVGLVYIALADEQAETQWRRCQFSGNRLMVRIKTVQTALDMLRQRLLTRGES